MTSVDRVQGNPVQIVRQSNGKFESDMKAVEGVLLHPDVKDMEVCVISVAGAFRKGKSFILSFIINYLEQASEGQCDLKDWRSAESDVPIGFKWRGGSKRETTGIWAWSRVFIIKKIVITGNTETDFPIAVLLLDTQGTFDSESSVKDSTTIFALSTLISSVLVYNLSQNIQEDDLQHLQLFIEYGRLAMEETTDKPFQKLVFLVRDWPNPDEHGYGMKGGKTFLNQKLEKSGEHKDLINVRKGIEECFDQLECFLMPYPGKKVATNRGFTGKLAEMDEEFRGNLQQLMPLICAADKLVTKKIDGKMVTCGELATFLKTYTELFRGDDLPPVSSLVEATSEAHHLAALEKHKQRFSKDMRELCGANQPYQWPDELEAKMRALRDQAEKRFSDERKLGSSEKNQEYLDKLIECMTDLSNEHSLANRNKANFLTKIMRASAYILWPLAFLLGPPLKTVVDWCAQTGVGISSFMRESIDTITRVAGRIRASIGDWILPWILPRLPDVVSPIAQGVSRVIARLRVPLILILLMVVLSVFAGFLALIGLSTLSGHVYKLVILLLIIFLLWIIVSWVTSKVKLFKSCVDVVGDMLWDMLFLSFANINHNLI